MAPLWPLLKSRFIFEKSSLKRQSADIWLSETPSIAGSSSFDSMYPRVMSFVKFEINKTKLIIVNLHLDHEKEDTRKEQLKVAIHEIKKNKGYKILDMGCFCIKNSIFRQQNKINKSSSLFSNC